MPGVFIERPKMTKTTYQALKKHVLKEREKKKQEQEQGRALERLREERARRQKKAQEDHSNLEQVTKQITEAQLKLEQLKNDKHEMFLQLKKTLAQEEECRKKAQLKEKSEASTSQFSGGGVHASMYLQPSTHIPQHSRYMTQGGHGGRPLMPTAMKRTHSPSPPPRSSSYGAVTVGAYRHPPAASYPSAVSTASASKPVAYSTPLTYINQSGHSYPASSQPGGHSHLPTAVVGPMDRGGPPSSLPTPAVSSQYPGGQFAGFPGHYPGTQQQQQTLGDLYAQANRASPHTNPYPRMTQAAARAANFPLALQQQLEQANHQAGFSAEERHKAAQAAQAAQQQVLRGLPQQAAAQLAAQHKGGITTGYPVRTQASSSTYQQPPQHRGGY